MARPANASQGDCEGNPDFVLKHCPVACGVCKPKCKDLHEGCPAWSAAGECNNNTAFMLKHCPASCDVCTNETLHTPAALKTDEQLASPGHCHDVSGLDCNGWVQSGECTSNPGFMLKHCAKSCGLCTAVCMDHQPECAGWAQLQEGAECDQNRAFMQATCPASCGVCSELQKHLAATKKDEL